MLPPVAGRRAVSRTTWPLLAVVITAGIFLAACSSNTSASGGLPSLTSSCSSSRSQSGTQQIPFVVDTTQAGPLAVVAICINHQGPYPFALSTGAGASVITPALQQTLGLAAQPSVEVRGATCQSSAPQVAVHALSMAGITLASQKFLVADVPDYGISGPPQGLIGSDILSRFGSIRIDYKTKQITLVRPQGPAPTGNVIVFGQASAGPPSGLVKSGPELGAPLNVVESPAYALVSTPVSVGGGTQSFIVDTGSPSSPAASSTASSLSHGSGTADKAGVGCSGTAPTVSSGSWSLAGTALPTTSMVSQTYAGSVNQPIGGALGADVLSSYHSLIVDYSGAHLWLGVG